MEDHTEPLIQSRHVPGTAYSIWAHGWPHECEIGAENHHSCEFPRSAVPASGLYILVWDVG